MSGEGLLSVPQRSGVFTPSPGVIYFDEEIDLRVRVGAKIADEKKILLWGTEIPAGTIGKGELGVYAVVNMEGEITLVADLQQSIDVGLVAKGGTCWFLPTSIRNASWFNHTCDVAFEAETKLKAFAGLHCAATLQIKSYKVLDIYLRGGMEGTVESDLTTLSADVGVRMKAGGKAYGSVAAARSKYSTATTASPAGNSSSPSAIRGMLRQNVARGIATMTHQEITRRVKAFKAGLQAYRGPISFTVREKQGAQLQAVTPRNGGTARTARNRATAVAEKVREMRGMVDHPLGWFVVGNLDIRPGQEVKAVIELEGFTIESEWLESDGLMVSSILHEGMESERTVDSETLRAHNSVVVVSAIRGDEPPRGTVSMLLGDDLPHAGILNSETIAAFPEATHAISHIDTTVVLQPHPGAAGTSIASSGPWSSRVQTNPGVLILPARNGRHPFERVSYLYEGLELGHSYLIDECHSCRSPQEVINRADQFGRLRQEGALQQLGRRLMKEQPKVRPLTGGTLRF